MASAGVQHPLPPAPNPGQSRIRLTRFCSISGGVSSDPAEGTNPLHQNLGSACVCECRSAAPGARVLASPQAALGWWGGLERSRLCLWLVGVEWSWQNSGRWEVFLSLSPAVGLSSLLAYVPRIFSLVFPEFLACSVRRDGKIDVLEVNDSGRKAYLCKKPHFSLTMFTVYMLK